MKRTLKVAGIAIGCFVLLDLVLFSAIYFSSYVPEDLETVKPACQADVPVLKAGQKIKVLVWNVQYMAGKNYVFFYDLPAGDGPDIRPKSSDIQITFGEVARIIKDEKPDIVLLQELHDNSVTTDHEDQLAKLMERLPGMFSCTAQTLYWKAAFVPHPKIMGSVGMKLGTLSRYKMSRALRHALPPIPADPVSMRLGFHRAVLEVHLPVENGKDFVALNTHMDAFSGSTDTMDRQVAVVKKALENLEGFPWLLGGDFNLLPPGIPRSDLPQDEWVFYNAKTEITPLFDAFQSSVSRETLAGPDRARYFTLNPNNPKITNKPDRTIDYIFYSRLLKLNKYEVRKHDTMKISDHLPLVAEITLP